VLPFLALSAVVLAVILGYASVYVREEYGRLASIIASLDIDGFTGEGPPSLSRQAQVVLTDLVTGASAFEVTNITRDLEWMPSASMEGLRVTKAYKSESSSEGEKGFFNKNKLMSKVNGKKAIIVGTIRMGFGHHRIAYAACSWALATKKYEVYFHDLLAVDAPEANLIGDSHKMYRKSSKMATELGGPFEWIHGFMTRNGDSTSLRSTALIAARLTPLLRGLPKNAPVIASHSLVAISATLSGVTDKVVNLVIDNHPQWFVVAPTAVNLVQGPRNYLGFIAKTGRVDGNLRLAGHWIPQELVTSAEADANLREARLMAKAKNATAHPLRLLVPIGGAGAQRKFITGFLKNLADDVKRGEVALIINAGDHDKNIHFVKTVDDLRTFADNLLLDIDGLSPAEVLKKKHKNDKKAPFTVPRVTVCAFDDYFAAVSATDILARGVDLMAAKPSELAFYPVPKLMIRRVGDHEAYSANRANELGEGTAEVRNFMEAVSHVRIFTKHPEPLIFMNAALKRNALMGVYDGAKNAVAIATTPAHFSSS